MHVSNKLRTEGLKLQVTEAHKMVGHLANVSLLDAECLLKKGRVTEQK